MASLKRVMSTRSVSRVLSEASPQSLSTLARSARYSESSWLMVKPARKRSAA